MHIWCGGGSCCWVRYCGAVAAAWCGGAVLGDVYNLAGKRGERAGACVSVNSREEQRD